MGSVERNFGLTVEEIKKCFFFINIIVWWVVGGDVSNRGGQRRMVYNHCLVHGWMPLYQCHLYFW